MSKRSQRSNFFNEDDPNDQYGTRTLPPIPKSRQSFQSNQLQADDASTLLPMSTMQSQKYFAATGTGGQGNQGPLPTAGPAANLGNYDLMSKIRELEIQMIDLKGVTDRKINQIAEQIPSRLDREFKVIEKRDEEVNRQNNSAISIASEQVNAIKEHVASQIEQMNDRYVSIRYKVDENATRLSHLNQTVEAIKHNTMSGAGYQQTAAPASGNNILNLADMESELRILREFVQDTKMKQEQQYLEQNQLFQQVQAQFHNQEHELLKRMKETREDQLQLLAQTSDDKLLADKLKQEKVNNDFGYIKGMIMTLDKRLDDETNFRIRASDDMRQWFDKKIQVMNERYSLEERNSLDRERRIMSQLEEGLTTLSDIIREVKTSTALGIQEVHTSSQELVTDLKQQNYGLREQVSEKLANYDVVIKETQLKVGELQDSTMKHAQKVNEMVEKEVERLEKVSSTLETYITSQISEMRESLKDTNEKLDKWSLNFEDVEGKKFIEMHAAIKMLNENFAKITKDNKDRFDIIQFEVTALDSALRNQIGDLKAKSNIDNQNIEERLSLMIETAFQKMRCGQESIVNGEQFTGAGTELNNRITHVRDELKGYFDKLSFQITEKLIENKHESETLLEGRAQEFTVRAERNFKESFERFKEDQAVFAAEQRTKLKEWEADIQESIAKIKGENTRKDKIYDDVNRETKKWLDGQLQASMKEFTALVDKKNAETELAIRKLILKNGQGENGREMQSSEMRALKEKNLLDYVDTMIKNLRHELLQQLEDEKSTKLSKFDEVNRLIKMHKNLTDEHITQQGESLKALLKANIHRETAERNKDIEKITSMMHKRFDSQREVYEHRLGEEVQRLIMRLDMNRAEFMEARDGHEKRIQNLHDRLNMQHDRLIDLEKEMHEKTDDLSKRLKEDTDKIKRDQEAQAIINTMITKIENDVGDNRSKSIEDRIEKVELKVTVDEMMNKVAQDDLHQNINQTNQVIKDDVNNYVGQVNDTSSKQYQDFNQQLKETFGQSMTQVQDMIQNMSDELQTAKSQLQEIKNQVEENDINSRKAMSELRDKVEVKGMVGDLVGKVEDDNK